MVFWVILPILCLFTLWNGIMISYNSSTSMIFGTTTGSSSMNTTITTSTTSTSTATIPPVWNITIDNTTSSDGIIVDAPSLPNQVWL